MRGWDEALAPIPVALRHAGLGLSALVGREPVPADPQSRWHISVQADGRVPIWEEIVRTAHELRPGVVFCVGVPPRSLWMNHHPYVLHLWELRDAGLTAEYRANATGDAPS